MNQRLPNWNISELYSKAWHIVKNNKMLWILGMAALGISSGSSRFNSSSNNIGKLFHSSPSPTPVVRTLPTSDLLLPNQNFYPSHSPFYYNLSHLFTSVPIWMYVLLIAGFILFIIIGATLNFIFSTWAEGALISGTYFASLDQKPTISQASNQSFKSLKGLIWLKIVPSLVFALIAGIIFLVLFFSFSIAPLIFKIIVGILGFLLFLLFILGIVYIGLIQIWAIRRVVIDQKSGKLSFFSSFNIVKQKFWQMLLLSLVNTLCSFVVGIVMIVPLLIIGGIGIASFFVWQNSHSIPVILLSIGGIFLLIYIFVSTLLGGILNAFKASVWTLAYAVIKGGFDE